jgi:5-formyltetrahydrofolate cyclo-ligase
MPAGEIVTDAIVYDAFKQGKEVFVPITYKASQQQPGQPSMVMDMLQLAGVEDFDNLNRDKWGIPSLDPESSFQRRNCFGGTGRTERQSIDESAQPCRSVLDLVLVPGQAFDATFGRLGHGKGFYDYFFERCKLHGESRNLQMPLLGM